MIKGLKLAGALWGMIMYGFGVIVGSFPSWIACRSWASAISLVMGILILAFGFWWYWKWRVES